VNRPYNRLLQHTSKSKFDVGRIISSPTNHQATTTYFRPKKNGPSKEPLPRRTVFANGKYWARHPTRMNAPMFAPSTSTHKNFFHRKVFCGAFFQKSDHPAPQRPQAHSTPSPFSCKPKGRKKQEREGGFGKILSSFCVVNQVTFC